MSDVAPDIDICQYSSVSKSQLTLTPVETAACCSPLMREPLSSGQADRLAPLLKACLLYTSPSPRDGLLEVVDVEGELDTGHGFLLG